MKRTLQESQLWVMRVFLAAVALAVFLNPGVGYAHGSSNSADLACVERQLLDLGVPNIFPGAPTGPMVGIDSVGNILTAWGYEFSEPGQLYTARFDVVTGWESKRLMDTGTAMDRVFLPTLAVNSSGAGLLAWSGQRGIYAVAYLPGRGWQETQTILSGTSPFLTFADEFEQLAIDNAGNGLLVWTQYGAELYGSWYKAGVGWSAPEIIVKRESIARGISLAMNQDGKAILLWSQGNSINNQVTLNASHFTPGVGWQPPVVLHTSDSLHTRPHVAINSKGEAMAAWLDYGGSSNFPVYASRFIPGQGWQPPNLVSGISMPSFEPWVDMDNAGNAVVIWTTLGNPTVSARHYLKDIGWQGIEVLKQYLSGGPLNSRVKMDDQGNAIATWKTPELSGRTDARRFQPATGWQKFDFSGGPWQSRARLKSLAMNSDGLLAAGWEDLYEVFDGQFYNTLTDLHTSRFSILCPTAALTVATAGSGLGFGWAVINPPIIGCDEECSESYVVGTVVTLIAVASHESILFTGWSGGGCSGTGLCTVTMNADTFITATFSQIFTLSVSKIGTGGGTVISSPAGINCGTDCSGTYDKGIFVTLTATPAPGSIFAGWAPGDCSGTGTCTVFMSRGISVTAIFDLGTPGPLTIGASPLPEGEVGVAYNASLEISGGLPPYTVNVISGALPSGLSVNSPNITGTPTVAGRKSFKVQVTDRLGSSVTRKFKIKVYKLLRIKTESLKVGAVGKGYKATIKASRGKKPFTWSLVSGSLPGGLSFDFATGKITGIPTVAGSVNLTFQVSDTLGGQTQKNFTLTIN